VGMETGVEAYCRRFGPALEEWFEPWGLPYAAAAPDAELLKKINEHLFVLEQLDRWYEESPGTTKSERHAALDGIFADHPLARDVLRIARQSTRASMAGARRRGFGSLAVGEARWWGHLRPSPTPARPASRSGAP
jgi:hypothetical protein